MGLTPADVQDLTFDQIYLMLCDVEELKGKKRTISVNEAVNRGLVERPEGFGSVAEMITARVEAKKDKEKRRASRRERRRKRRERRANQGS